ncbi:MULTISPECIES: CRISPR-associated protein Cas4 [Fusobacterium]|jgi:CRISPR-associated protein Cas4|uniref:CRISPR-associated exonuclease Cas4 n=2 Tax=Fusobacterium TaxID=848 RepID=A0A323TZT1_FUSNU|nr:MULTISPECIES: CRISPR-associated protein Cas4 [Fusobacterium]ASC02435.1 CRISPR-associated protein Cas4 [Fusobacterium polymorphum]EUB15725.1 CRISPR-associated protein Cas4 [Fusobacterium sp. CM22]EUB30943.1 CRISPR-associated protein Cas4 [Fusobacterium sp. OBRC1]MBW9310860.1 CRISPR-associated protein Cas4 [Fusobacterium nucleatum]OWP25180.1 CRISPR-associated protein Cas4 [Fusobacterium polymorphum]
MDKDITGLMVYYYEVCKRKLWYFVNEIQLEENNSNVILGKLLEENTYTRDEKKINIDGVINIDFIRSKKILHEIKKSNSIEPASLLQVQYYLYYLEKKGLIGLKGILDYPLLKQTVEVNLTDKDRENLDNIIIGIKEILRKESPPALEKNGICKKCAYFDLCFV